MRFCQVDGGNHRGSRESTPSPTIGMCCVGCCSNWAASLVLFTAPQLRGGSFLGWIARISAIAKGRERTSPQLRMFRTVPHCSPGMPRRLCGSPFRGWPKVGAKGPHYHVTNRGPGSPFERRSSKPVKANTPLGPLARSAQYCYFLARSGVARWRPLPKPSVLTIWIGRKAGFA